MSGHSVSLTVHGQEAIELFERDPSKFDLILMDLQLSIYGFFCEVVARILTRHNLFRRITNRMPICDGIEATRKIREFERSSFRPSRESVDDEVNLRIPIIAVSASLHERQREDIMDAGMDGWILKPLDCFTG
ncbi:hypothetical protein VP01_1133g3 [Puccinia sorghi]|uniref:Response regulatory domain-containing protein n=1 Tax=Puccinia sorghi TaxID=27349 RepID=A0A0L6VS33_9BASI|nr:hypothetical protein VP01_1133g3 [Puccinia sorghi]